MWGGRLPFLPSDDAEVVVFDLCPIDDIPPRLDVVRTAILVLEVVGMLSNINAQNWDHTPRRQLVLIFGLQDDQTSVRGTDV